MITPITSDILKARTDRVREAMRRQELDALVLYSNPSRHGAGTSTAGNVRYFTNVTGKEGALLLALPVEGDPTLICARSYSMLGIHPSSPDLAGHVPPLEDFWVKDIRSVPRPNQGRAVRELLEKRCRPTARVGIVGRSEMPAPIYAGLTGGASSLRFEDADKVIALARMIKGPEEVQRHRIAAEICDAMFEALVRSARGEGKPAWQVMVDMEYAGCSRRAEHARTWLAIGGGWASFMASDSLLTRQLRDGDSIFAGTYLIFEGYWAHSLRAAFKGEPTPAFRKIFDVLTEVENLGIERLKPGEPLLEVTRAISGLMDRHFPGEGRRRMGHALGLDYADPLVSDYFHHPEDPVRDLDPTFVLQPGMVFALHPSVREMPELGCNFGLIGDTILITESGNEILSRFRREILQV